MVFISASYTARQHRNPKCGLVVGVTRMAYSPRLSDGSWLVKQNQTVSKIGTKSDTNLRSLYES
jgi:hypothetical protein